MLSLGTVLGASSCAASSFGAAFRLAIAGSSSDRVPQFKPSATSIAKTRPGTGALGHALPRRSGFMLGRGQWSLEPDDNGGILLGPRLPARRRGGVEDARSRGAQGRALRLLLDL